MLLLCLSRRDLPTHSHKGEAIWKGLKKSKYYVCFVSELSLRPMKVSEYEFAFISGCAPYCF